jgi:hypothetical protein
VETSVGTAISAAPWHVLLGEQPVRVLDRHGGVVDQDTDRQREPAERHGVDGLAHEIENDQRSEDRQRDRDHHHQGRAPGAEEQDDHHRGEHTGDGAFLQERDDRCLDEDGLVEQLLDRHARGRGGTRGDERVLHRIDDGERGGIAVLDDGEQHRAVAVGAHHVLLHRVAVMHLADVLDEHGGTARILDRDVVEIVDGGRNRVGAHGELGVADLGEARRQRQVLGVDGVDDVERGQPLGLQLERVDVDHDLAVLAAGWRRQRHAVDRGELLAQAVDAVVVELLLVQRVGRKPDLQHGHAGCIVLHHHRRLDARRHQHADEVGGRDDLRNREVEVDVRLEEHLLHRDAVQRLGLNVLDAVDAGGQCELAVGRDALLHLGRRQPGVLPDDGHDGDVDLGKDVRRHRHNRGRAKEQHQHRQHVKGVGKSQCEANNSHDKSPNWLSWLTLPKVHSRI